MSSSREGGMSRSHDLQVDRCSCTSSGTVDSTDRTWVQQDQMRCMTSVDDHFLVPPVWLSFGLLCILHDGHVVEGRH